MTSEQRRRNLERRVREIETRRALLEDKIIAAGSSSLPEWAHALAALESELIDAQAEIMDGAAGDARQQSRDRAVLILNERMVAVESTLRGLSDRVATLEKRLSDWFQQEAEDRDHRRFVQNGYGIVVVAVVIVDVIVRVVTR